MNAINKAQWVTEQDHINLSMPLTKIDTENRLVSGFATLDNTDSHDEVVVSEASNKAFDRFRGNVREMHANIAAGKMVGFTQESYYDTKTEKFYDGIYATVYVSKGAPLTWEKVLDGTLTGFSIGGNILEAESQYVPELGKTVRFIKDYELIELSLVDNPANQLANVFSITKSADGAVMQGMIVDTETENVFYCKTDEIVKTSTEEQLDCPNCRDKMDLAGWFEMDDTTKSEKVKSVVQKYLAKSDNPQGEPATNEGGVDVVVEDTVEKNAVVTEEPIPVVEEGKAETEVDAAVENVAAEAAVDEAADVSEVPDAGDDLAKMFDGLKTDITTSLEKNAEVVQTALGGLTERLDTVTADVETKNSEWTQKFAELSDKFAEVEARLGTTEKSLSVLDDATAVRKSSDLGGSTEAPVVEKSNTSIWGGHFVGADSLL